MTWTTQNLDELKVEGIDVEHELCNLLEQEIEKELIAAGHGTRAERDQKIINQLLGIHKQMQAEDYSHAMSILEGIVGENNERK